MAWYRTMERVLPRSVTLNLPGYGLGILAQRGNLPNRSSIVIFDQMVGLPPTRCFTSPQVPVKIPGGVNQKVLGTFVERFLSICYASR
jgi:hypothetical protein